MLAKHTKKGIDERARQGKHLGSLPFGYEACWTQKDGEKTLIDVSIKDWTNEIVPIFIEEGGVEGSLTKVTFESVCKIRKTVCEVVVADSLSRFLPDVLLRIEIR
jgi:hypothetical protein